MWFIEIINLLPTRYDIPKTFESLPTCEQMNPLHTLNVYLFFKFMYYFTQSCFITWRCLLIIIKKTIRNRQKVTYLFLLNTYQSLSLNFYLLKYCTYVLNSIDLKVQHKTSFLVYEFYIKWLRHLSVYLSTTTLY